MKWKYYLQSQPFEVITDHRPLLAMKESTQSYLQRWRLRLAPYSFKIRWHPGEHMGTEDALSRDSRHEAVPMCSLVSFEERIEDEGARGEGLQVVRGKEFSAMVAEEPEERTRLQELEQAFMPAPKEQRAWDEKVNALRRVNGKHRGTLNQQKNLKHVASDFICQPMAWTWNHTEAGWSARKPRDQNGGVTTSVSMHQLVEEHGGNPAEDLDAEGIIDMLNPTHDSFQEMQEADPEIKLVKQYLTGETAAMSRAEQQQAQGHARGCKLLHDIVVKQRPATGAWVPWVPKPHRPTVLYLCHDHALGAHVG